MHAPRRHLLGRRVLDEQAQNAVDFADNGTVTELEVMLGIGPSIANKIVAARPFGTGANPMEALDRVSYVGPMLLGRFQADTYSLWCSLDAAARAAASTCPATASAAPSAASS